MSGSDNSKLETQNSKPRHPVTLFTHGRLEPGKGVDTLVKVWKELKQVKNDQ